MIHARKLRDLTLEPGERPHLAAASGLVRVDEWLYVIADDANFLGVFPAEGNAPGRRLPFDHSSLPQDHAARKAAKPDLEALAHIPREVWPPYGALLALASGSTPRRRRGLLIAFNADGSAGAQRLLDLSPLYTSLETEIPELNIEGAAVVGHSLRLLQRGNGRAGMNAIVDLDLGGVCEHLASSQTLPASLVRGIQRCDLGTHGGLRLTFTDASPLPDGRMVFAAVAEDCPNTYEDGPVVAAALGIMDARGRVMAMESLDPVLKIEGVHATLQEDGIALLLVADADNEARPAPLLAAKLRDPAR
ncbi:MAG: DUF6929 family protein [Terriglobales bacterium]